MQKLNYKSHTKRKRVSQVNQRNVWARFNQKKNNKIESKLLNKTKIFLDQAKKELN